MTSTTLTLPNSVFVESCTRLRMWGASKDSVLLAFTTSGGPSFGAIVAICKFMIDKFKFVSLFIFWKMYHNGETGRPYRVFNKKMFIFSKVFALRACVFLTSAENWTLTRHEHISNLKVLCKNKVDLSNYNRPTSPTIFRVNRRVINELIHFHDLKPSIIQMYCPYLFSLTFFEYQLLQYS